MIQTEPFSLILSIAAQRAESVNQLEYVTAWQETIQQIERSFSLPAAQN